MGVGVWSDASILILFIASLASTVANSTLGKVTDPSRKDVVNTETMLEQRSSTRRLGNTETWRDTTAVT